LLDSESRKSIELKPFDFIDSMLLLRREEKEHLVIQLAMEGKTTREMVKTAHVSLKDIGSIIRRFTGEESEYQNKTPSMTSKAFAMFKENKSRVDVAIALNLNAEDVVTLFEDYMSLLNLDKHLKRTLKMLSTKFHGGSTPSVLWTGNGHHIYQPVDGIVFEKTDIFYEFLPYLDGRDLTTEFLRFSERFFTNGKSDPQHSPSVKSCLIRVPGTFNAKNGEEVRIIQKWDGKGPQYNG